MIGPFFWEAARKTARPSMQRAERSSCSTPFHASVGSDPEEVTRPIAGDLRICSQSIACRSNSSDACIGLLVQTGARSLGNNILFLSAELVPTPFPDTSRSLRQIMVRIK